MPTMASDIVHIAIIDDEPSVLKILAAFAERLFHTHRIKVHVTQITNPVDALFELSSSEKPFPDLVLLDVRMPKVNGNNIYESVAMVTPQFASRICFVTGYAGDIELGDKAPILKKPFHYDDFEKIILEMKLPALAGK